MIAKLALCAALLAAVCAPAHARCRDDLNTLKPRIDRLKYVSPQRYRLALLWWGKAVEAEPGSETECLHFVAMTRKALFSPIEEIAACDEPNMALPRCQNPGGQDFGINVGPVEPVDAIGLGGGGGGQVGAAGAGGAGAPFTPPGSPTTGTGVEATGRDR
jgi:hypothetical protein